MLSYQPIQSLQTIQPIQPIQLIQPLQAIQSIQLIQSIQPICSICATRDLVLPCLTCGRPQCETCFFHASEEEKKQCQGCRLEKWLEMDQEHDVWSVEGLEEEGKEEEGKEEEGKEEEGKEEEEPGRMVLFSSFTVSSPHPDYPQECVEQGTMIFRPIVYPSEEEWRYASQVLESHILFTASDAGLSQPHPYARYLVGRVYDATPTSITTDYMLSYEHDPRNPSKMMWIKYMATYYNQSPMPHEKNVFYPYRLPLSLLRPPFHPHLHPHLHPHPHYDSYSPAI